MIRFNLDVIYQTAWTSQLPIEALPDALFQPLSFILECEAARGWFCFRGGWHLLSGKRAVLSL